MPFAIAKWPEYPDPRNGIFSRPGFSKDAVLPYCWNVIGETPVASWDQVFTGIKCRYDPTRAPNYFFVSDPFGDDTNSVELQIIGTDYPGSIGGATNSTVKIIATFIDGTVGYTSQGFEYYALPHPIRTFVFGRPSDVFGNYRPLFGNGTIHPLPWDSPPT